MMKYNLYFQVTLFVVLIIASMACDGENTEPDKLFITANKTIILADGLDEVILTVKNGQNEDFSASCIIYVNDKQIAGNKFMTDLPGNYKIRAKKSNVLSDTVSVEATDPGPLSYTHKVLCEDYTGAWCGHCPRVGIQLDNYVSQNNPNCIVVGIHNGDPFAYIYESQMRNTFNVLGFPTVIINRSFKWNEKNSVLDNATQKKTFLGLAIESGKTISSVQVKVKVKSDVTIVVPLRIVVMLVESNLIYPQTNYGYYSLPGTISDYNHKNVLRHAATNAFGDNIPANSIVKNVEWISDYTFDVSKYVVDNCKVIAFVVYAPENKPHVGVLNVQEVAAGKNKAYD